MEESAATKDKYILLSVALSLYPTYYLPVRSGITTLSYPLTRI